MTHAPLAAALVLALAACGQSPGDRVPVLPDREAASPPQAADTGYIAGTGDAIAPAAPATDEVPTTPGSDAEDAQYFDFSGDALAVVRARARPATPELRDAARRIVDATGEERGCGAYPEGERLFMLDLDDLHWCDHSSKHVLRFLMRRLDGLPVAMLLTHRPMGQWPGEVRHASSQLATMVRHR